MVRSLGTYFPAQKAILSMKMAASGKVVFMRREKNEVLKKRRVLEKKIC